MRIQDSSSTVVVKFNCTRAWLRGRFTVAHVRKTVRGASGRRHLEALPRTLRHLLRLVVVLPAVLGAASAYAQFTSITSTPVTTVVTGQPYVYEVTSSSANGGPATVTAPNGIPGWLTLVPHGDAATLSGTPSGPPGTVYTISLRAENASCLNFFGGVFCGSQTFDITVVPAPNLPPVVVAPGLADRSVQAGQPVSIDVATAFADPDGNALTFAASGLPASLTLSGSIISGTPTVADLALSPYTVTVTATDGQNGTVSDAFAMTVSQNRPPTVVAPGIPDRSVTEGQSLSLNVASAFTDPDADPLTLSATGLPAGFSLAGGIISGVATGGLVQGSPYTVSVTANDGRGGTVADAFRLTIVPLARADVFVSSFAASPSPALLNAGIEWTITVGNSGPSPSGSINLELVFGGVPLTFTASTCTVSVAADRQNVACVLGPIASGATQSLKLTASAAQAGDVYATAFLNTVGASPIDPSVTNNRGAASVNVAEVIVSEPAQSIGLGGTASAAGDLNKDGFSDLVLVANGEQPGLLLAIESPTSLNPALAQAGDKRRGLASIALSFGTSGAGADVAVADFDGDQDLDVVVANGPGIASAVYRNDGNAVLTELATLGAASRNDRTLAVADMNGDSRPDIVIGSANANTIYLNQAGTTFAATALPTASGAGAVDVVLVDVVGSTLPDVIFVYGSGAVARYENVNGTVSGTAVAVDAGPVSVAAAADFNRDGRADLLLGRGGPAPSGLPSKAVYLNNNAGGFTAGAALGATPTTNLALGDIDADGLTDFVAINATGAHQAYLGDGNGGFRLHPRVFVAAGATGGAIAAIGLLQKPDLAIAGPNATAVFFGDGRGNLGLGDTTRPVIQLTGPPEIIIEVGGTYADQGATATDDVDGPLTPTLTSPSPVDAAVIGTYTVTYAAIDKAGNAALPVSRTVRVNAAAEGGGGGGAVGVWSLLSLLGALAAARRRKLRAATGKPAFESAADAPR